VPTVLEDHDAGPDKSQIDMGSEGGPTDPLYPYHSNYDSYHWMATFGDPGFHVHEAMGQYLSLLAYNLATAELIPFNVPNYADQMDIYFDELTEVISSSSSNVSVSELRDAIDTFRTQANEVVELSQLAVSSNDTELLQVVNHKYRDFQRGFTSQGGLANREFYQHTIFAPGIDTGKFDQWSRWRRYANTRRLRTSHLPRYYRGHRCWQLHARRRVGT
jgi:N-acetylated-alpha-linked acidic dipeptidase